MKRLMLLALSCAVVASLASPAMAQKTRESVGLETMFGWFPADRTALKTMVDKFLADAGDVKVGGRPIAIVAPHAGYRYSGATAAYAFKPLVGQKYDRVIVIAPSHFVGFTGGSIGDFDAYATPMGSIELDKPVCKKLLATGIVQTVPEADRKEHSLQNVLPFLQTVQPDLKMVPIIVGGQQSDASLEKLGDAIRSVVTPDTLIVVSSDFTHYGAGYNYTPYETDVKENMKKGDMGAANFICANDFAGFRAYMKKRDSPNICGAEPITVLLRVLAGRKEVRGSVVRYANSGDASKKYDLCVSYCSIVLTKEEGVLEPPLKVETIIEEGPGKEKPETVPDKLNENDMKTLLLMSREQLTMAVTDRRTLDIKEYRWDIGRKLLSQGGAYVTLTNRGRLRGSMGDPYPTRPIYLSVITNTAKAASGDPRFARDRITVPELPQIDIEITVLGKPVLVSSYTEIVLGKHGVLLELGARNAIFLPQTALEMHWDRETMLKQLSLKAGLDENAYKNKDAKFWIFEGQAFNEKEYKTRESKEDR